MGYTSPGGFPTTSGAYDTSFNGDVDVFISKLDSNLSDGTAQPHINDLSSYFGTHGTAVTMNGVHFGVTQGVVNFGATMASVTSWNDTSIVITIPELPPETYSISVTTNGQTSNALSFLLTEAPSGSDFSIDAKPPKQTVVRGSFALYSVFIKSINGFNKPVTLQVNGLPQGASASFQRNPVFPGEWVDLTITTTKKTPVKIHSFTVKGRSPGLKHVKSAKLEVKPAKTVVNLKRSYSPELTVLLIATNKNQTGDKIIANVSLINTTGTWVKATLNQEEQNSASINKFEDYVILLGPYATKSLGPITFQKGEHLHYDGDRVSFEPLTVLAIDLFLRGALGHEVPPNAFMNVFSYYDYGNTLLGDVLRKLLDEEFGCSSLAIDFGKDLKEGNAIDVLNDLAELLQCTGAIKQEMQKLFMQVLKNKKLAKKAANFLDDGVAKILGLLQIPDHYVEFNILMCPSLVPPIDGYFESLGLCNTLGSPLEGFVCLEAEAE